MSGLQLKWMYYGKCFLFVDLLIVIMIIYGRFLFFGVVGDYFGEIIICKGRSMNIQLMNVVVDIIEQWLVLLVNVLMCNNYIMVMCDSFVLVMFFVIVGSLLVFILFLFVFIDGVLCFGQVYLLLWFILLLIFQLIIGLVVLIVVFGVSVSFVKQYCLLEWFCGLIGCLVFLLFIGFCEIVVSNVYFGGMGIFIVLIFSIYFIEIICFFYKKGWCICLFDEVLLMICNGF